MILETIFKSFWMFNDVYECRLCGVEAGDPHPNCPVAELGRYLKEREAANG